MLCADPRTLGLRTFAHAAPRPEKAFSFFIPQLSHSLDSQSLWPGLLQHPSLLQQGHRIKEWSIGRALCPSSPGDGPKLDQSVSSVGLWLPLLVVLCLWGHLATTWGEVV